MGGECVQLLVMDALCISKINKLSIGPSLKLNLASCLIGPCFALPFHRLFFFMPAPNVACPET